MPVKRRDGFISWKDIDVPKITPFLWFNDNAKEALTFSCSLFEDSEIGASPGMAKAALASQVPP